MPDDTAPAFIPEGQSEYAFPSGQGEQDEAAASEQRNQQIQSAFDQQRFQRSYMQGLGKEVAQLARRQAQQKT